MNAVTRFCAAFANSVQRRVLRRRLGRAVLERVDGESILVLPGVFNPAVFRTGTVLARAVATSPLASMPSRQASGSSEVPRALDMGTGSGIGAVFAARRGYNVIAVDLNPEAVRCARINGLLNGLDERIEVRRGDLYEPLNGERFDLVMFNPPFFRGSPSDWLDAAWRSSDVIERFAAGLPAVLKPRGKAFILLSSDGEKEAMLQALRRAGMDVETAAERDYWNELVTVYCARKPPAVPGPVEPARDKDRAAVPAGEATYQNG